MRVVRVALVLFAACGRAEPPARAAEPTPTPTPTPPPAPTVVADGGTASTGYCRHEVTGALSGHGESPANDLALTADYFMTRDEHRRAYLALGVPPDEIDARMQHDPLMNLFTLHCEGFLDLYIAAGDRMKYADLPFGPGTYEIAPRPDRVNARFSSPATLDRISAERGELVLERFDGRGAAGTFAFGATLPTGDVRVTGRFDLPCLHPTSVCNGARSK